jgi:hypothetical protein
VFASQPSARCHPCLPAFRMLKPARTGCVGLGCGVFSDNAAMLAKLERVGGCRGVETEGARDYLTTWLQQGDLVLGTHVGRRNVRRAAEEAILKWS